MEKTVKILLIACIILVAALGLVVGMLIGSPDNTSLALNTSNNSNLSANTTNNTTVSNSNEEQKSKYINRSKAMAIANNYASQYGAEAAGLTYIDFIDGKGKYYGADGNSYYHIELKWKSGYSQSYDAGYVEIDAVTGAINPRS